MLKVKRIFNPEGDDRPENRALVGGNTTNLMQLNQVRYRWAIPLYRRMLANFWIPEKVDLTTDFASFNKLSPPEQNAYKAVLSFLTFLDSIQTTNLPNISAWITAPEVVLCLTTHAFQEAVHAQSYQYMLETLFEPEERDRLYDLWRENSLLLERNQTIAGHYQAFLDNPTEETFQAALVANYLLEGLYFMNGFYFFYHLGSRNRMLRTMEIIKYIHRDEMTHLALFQHILRELYTPEQLQDTMVRLLESAVAQEIAWSTYIFQGIPGISEASIVQFTHYLADLRLRALNLPPLYNQKKNPYEALEKYSNVSESTVMANFFESTVTEYQMSSTVSGWDEF